MADLSEVEQAVVGLVAAALYPNGTAQPSVLGVKVKVYRGWPSKASLEADLAAGYVNITVVPNNVERSVTRYWSPWMKLSVAPITITGAVTNGDTITFGGTPTAGQNVVVTVDGSNFAHTIQPDDTLTSVATALAMAINPAHPASNTGPVLTIRASYELSVAFGTFGTSVREIGRIDRELQVDVWIADPAMRDTVGKLLVTLCSTSAGVADDHAGTVWLNLPDGTQARLIHRRTVVIDGEQKERLYRRLETVSVEYATTQTRSDPTVVTPIQNVTNH